MKLILLVVIALFAAQLTVVWFITAANRRFFANRTAAEYPRAIAALSREKPAAGLAIKACYAACLIEVLVIWALKYL